jgi:type I restriction enzyme M protein
VPEANSAEIGFEKQIWDAACILRGNMDAAEYKHEFCLGKFAEQEGKLAGEFYTPACVVRTLVEVIQPFNGRVYDPCCGSGGMFVQSAQFVEHHQGNINNLSVFGQDSNPTTWKLCQMNLAIRGIEANLGEAAADTFFKDLHPTLKADFILANPPFNLSDWGADKLQTDVRWKYGVPPAGNANFAWLQHMIHHLNAKGRMGMVLNEKKEQNEVSA